MRSFSRLLFLFALMGPFCLYAKFQYEKFSTLLEKVESDENPEPAKKALFDYIAENIEALKNDQSYFPMVERSLRARLSDEQKVEFLKSLNSGDDFLFAKLFLGIEFNKKNITLKDLIVLKERHFDRLKATNALSDAYLRMATEAAINSKDRVGSALDFIADQSDLKGIALHNRKVMQEAAKDFVRREWLSPKAGVKKQADLVWIPSSANFFTHEDILKIYSNADLRENLLGNLSLEKLLELHKPLPDSERQVVVEEIRNAFINADQQGERVKLSTLLSLQKNSDLNFLTKTAEYSAALSKRFKGDVLHDVPHRSTGLSDSSGLKTFFESEQNRLLFRESASPINVFRALGAGALRHVTEAGEKLDFAHLLLDANEQIASRTPRAFGAATNGGAESWGREFVKAFPPNDYPEIYWKMIASFPSKGIIPPSELEKALGSEGIATLIKVTEEKVGNHTALGYEGETTLIGTTKEEIGNPTALSLKELVTLPSKKPSGDTHMGATGNIIPVSNHQLPIIDYQTLNAATLALRDSEARDLATQWNSNSKILKALRASDNLYSSLLPKRNLQERVSALRDLAGRAKSSLGHMCKILLQE